jgi:hypothetical protein
VIQLSPHAALAALSKTGLIGEIRISNVLKIERTVRKTADFSKIHQII